MPLVTSNDSLSLKPIWLGQKYRVPKKKLLVKGQIDPSTCSPQGWHLFDPFAICILHTLKLLQKLFPAHLMLQHQRPQPQYFEAPNSWVEVGQNLRPLLCFLMAFSVCVCFLVLLGFVWWVITKLVPFWDENNHPRVFATEYGRGLHSFPYLELWLSDLLVFSERPLMLLK